MYKKFKEIVGLIGLIYAVAAISILLYQMLFGKSYEFEFQHILGLLLHWLFIYYCWHWMNGIIFFDDEDFLKEKDRYYKEAVMKAQDDLNKFIELFESVEGLPLVYLKFTNYRKKKVNAWAEVKEIDSKKKMMTVALLKKGDRELKEDYTYQKISFDVVIDWLFHINENRFEGGYLMKARVKKADDKGYDFDYKSEEIVQWIRNNN